MLEEYRKYIQGNKAIIPYGTKYIDDLAFADCKSLTNIEIPNSDFFCQFKEIIPNLKV